MLSALEMGGAASGEQIGKIGVAFVESSTWQVDSEPALQPPLVGLYLPSWAAHPLIGQLPWRRPAAMALAVLLHVFLVWVLLNRMGMGAGEAPGGGGGSVLTMINLTDSAADLEETPQEQTAQLSSTVTPPQPAEAEPDVESPAEWSITKIGVTRSTALPPSKPSPAPPPTMAANAEDAPGHTGGASGGGDIYDPYAGASPMRRDERHAGGLASRGPAAPGLADRILNALGLGGAATDMPQINQPVLDRMKRAVRHRFPAVRGSVDLAARISPTGQVLELIVRREDVGSEVLALIRQEMIGRALFAVQSHTTGPSLVDLPRLSF